MTEHGYIQGAGDDSEGWSHGLTPQIFWRHKTQLLNTVEEDISELIQQLIVENRESARHPVDATRIPPVDLYIGSSSSLIGIDSCDGVIVCSDSLPVELDPQKDVLKRRKILHFNCSDGKLGGRALREHLRRLVPFVSSIALDGKSPKILFTCSTGKDLSVGVALATLCLFFDDDCKYYRPYPW